MTVKTKLTEKDYLNACFALLFTKPIAKLLIGVGLFLLLITILLIILDPTISSFTDLFWPILVISILPLTTYFAAKRNFKSDQRISESIEYDLDENFYSIKGESFTAQLTWDKLYKVSKTKKWILIWNNKQSANVIPRSEFSEVEIYSLKNILTNHQVKNNL